MHDSDPFVGCIHPFGQFSQLVVGFNHVPGIIRQFGHTTSNQFELYGGISALFAQESSKIPSYNKSLSPEIVPLGVSFSKYNVVVKSTYVLCG